MNLVIVNFEDLTKDPAGVRANATPSPGLPDDWIDALVGAGSVFSRGYATAGMISTISVTFPSSGHAEQFCVSVRAVAHLCGTRAHTHKVPAEQAELTLREAKHGGRIV
ncbi:hypothetical protein [Candidatus Burkholderia verschuerenii]|uniref:hypothetical protein n=1 Tax=Candidatus Burkholderia verschuerenii TaxID=242163 RepID=UPI00067B7668|nr:hypothetical protein [Candidatus Burkholderia verschuerenii]